MSGSAPIRTATSRRPGATARTQAISLSPALARGARRGQIRQDAGLRPRPAAIRARVEADLARPRPAARTGAGGGRAAAGDDAVPRRQRGIRQGEQELRPDHAARPPCRGRGQPHPFRLPRQERHAAPDRHQRPPAGRASSSDCHDLPGHELFQYLDEDGEPRTVDSDDVNDYLREITGEEITAKDFRTWAGTLLAAQALRELEPSTPKAKQKAIVRAVETVAKQLGNTPAICRRAIFTPRSSTAIWTGRCLKTLAEKTQRYLVENVEGMSAEEAAVTAFLRLRLTETRRGEPRERRRSHPETDRNSG